MILSAPGRTTARRFFAACRIPKRRSYLEFAQSTIVIPKGPYKGRRFRPNFQPFTGLFLREMDTRRWPRVFVTGCAQAGKTFLLQVPLLYWILERRAPVVFGIPDMRLARNMWNEVMKPILRASRLDRLLPVSGAGSRGGELKDAMMFQGAGVLKIMSFGGGDAGRSGYTAEAVFVTEVDKGDTAGGQSREADPISQMEARKRSFGADGLFMGEATASITMGRVWSEIKKGTDSQIACPCPHCGEYVTPEREHLVGWQDAK